MLILVECLKFECFSTRATAWLFRFKIPSWSWTFSFNVILETWPDTYDLETVFYTICIMDVRKGVTNLAALSVALFRYPRKTDRTDIRLHVGARVKFKERWLFEVEARIPTQKFQSQLQNSNHNCCCTERKNDTLFWCLRTCQKSDQILGPQWYHISVFSGYLDPIFGFLRVSDTK